MATLFTNSLYNSNSTDPLFRAWATFIHNIFMLGFVNVTDAAQIDLTTVLKPAATQTSQGFKIYRTNDGLTPVYLKVEFGSGTAALQPSIWLTVSTGYTAGGTMGGLILMARYQLTGAVNDATNPHSCFGSGANNRVCFALFTSLASCPFWFSFERRKDANIADVDTGVLLDGGLDISAHWSLCAPFTGLIPTKEVGCQFILSSNNPAAYGNAIPEGLRIPCLGPSEPPGMNVAFCNANDYGAYAEPTLTINVTDVKFKHCGTLIKTLRCGGATCVDANTRLLLRYD
jgi:hypothetical protein